MENLIEILQSLLTEDLLKPKYRNSNKNKYWGHCYVASESYYHLLTDEEKKYIKPAILNINGDTHWFLKNNKNGEIIDLTKEQFNFKLPYYEAKNAAFLTKNPSKRALILINRIYEKIGY